MTIALKRGLWLPLLLSALQFASAQPSGQLTFVFGTDNAPVYDLSGGYVMNHSAVAGNLAQPVSFGIGIQNDAKGQLRGTGTSIAQIGDDYVAAPYTVTGKVTGGGEDTHVQLSVRLTGLDWIAGAYRKFSISLSYKLLVNPESLSADGTVSGSIYVASVGSSRINENVSVPLPPGVDGSWALGFNLLALDKIGGAALFAISNFTPIDHPVGLPTDRLLSGSVSGSYSTSPRKAKLSVTGLYNARGTSLSLVFDPEGNEVIKMSGHVLGQTVTIP
jgi:hypothetical protein